MRQFFTFFYFCFSSLGIYVHSQTVSNFHFQRYGVQDGLSQGSIRDMLQDTKGFWWFATADGLNRYDGYDFTTYHHHKEDPSTIISGDINRIYLDNEGDIWAISPHGCSKYNHLKNNFETYNFDNFLATKVFQESNQRFIWIHNAIGDIKVVSRDNGKVIKHYPNPNPINDVISLNDNEFLYLFSEKQIEVFNTRLEKWSSATKDVLLNKVSTAIVHNNHFLIGTEKGEFLICNKNFHVIERFNITNTKINQIAIFNNNFLFATAKGIFLMNISTKEISNIQNNVNEPKSLSSNLVSCLSVEKNGSLWVGTNTDGLNKLIPLTSKFNVIRSKDYYFIKSIYKYKNDNKLYCCILRKGLDIYDLNHPDLPPLTIANTKNIFKIEPWNDRYLLFFHAQGVQLYNIEKQTFIEVGSKVSQFENKPLLSTVFRLNSNSFLIGLNKKIYRYRNLEIVEPFSEAVFEDEITSLWSETNNEIYVGTSTGLYLLSNQKTKKVLIPNVYVKHITKTSDNSIWITTTTGLYKYTDGEAPKLYNSDSYGLANDFIYGVVEGAGNSLWLSHNRGLSRLNVSKSVFKNFNLNDNLQSFEFNTGAFFRSEDDLIVFGGVRGINYFKSNDFFDNPIAPIPIITNIRVNDSDLKTDTVIWNKKSIDLPYENNTLAFEFTGLQYANSVSNQYYYKMEGFDKDWIFAGNKRFARYPKLPSGNYIFKVRAINDDGNESDKIASFAIKIIAPIYLRWWFLLLAGICTIGTIITLLYYWQQRKYRKQMQALEISNRVKSERERISRDLHDNVGAQITYLISSMDWAAKQLPEGSDALEERFLTLRSNAQNMMSSIRDTIWALNKETIKVQDFADRLKQYIIYQIRDISAIELSYFENIEIEHILPSNTVLNLFRIGQEAIQNIIKHSEASVITVSIICQEEKTLLLAIGDDGKGFDLSAVNYDSFGLDNMNYRAIEIGGIFNIRTSPGKGTTVELRVQLDD